MSYSDPMKNRVNFKLNAAYSHLEKLKRLEAANKVLSGDKMETEMHIDEFFYHLVGVKDALLQEINSELNLSIAPHEVTIDSINTALNRKGVDARKITKEICNMISDESDPLWLINEFHNHSKHRNIIGKAIAIVVGISDTISLRNPRTGKEVRTDQGKMIPIIDYLEDSYEEIAKLQETIRHKVCEYPC
jgi:hypothetical protein